MLEYRISHYDTSRLPTNNQADRSTIWSNHGIDFEIPNATRIDAVIPYPRPCPIAFGILIILALINNNSGNPDILNNVREIHSFVLRTYSDHRLICIRGQKEHHLRFSNNRYIGTINPKRLIYFIKPRSDFDRNGFSPLSPATPYKLLSHSEFLDIGNLNYSLSQSDPLRYRKRNYGKCENREVSVNWIHYDQS
ncbi:MAG: hypothetical protein HN457_03550 [Opitutales bacterium]|nr:hypothetical protein [Opitutales bacterium]